MLHKTKILFFVLTFGFIQMSKSDPEPKTKEAIITPIEWIKPTIKSPLVKMHTDLWLDVDPGHGDGIAIFMAIYSKNFTVHGITATQGNTSGPNALRNTRILLSLFHKPEIPIYIGAQTALTAYTYHLKDDFHGTEGIPASLLQKSLSLPLPSPLGSIYQIYLRILSLPSPITYICAGPSTTLALLISSFPDILQKIDRVIYMAAATLHGNVTPYAEFNVYNDPESLYITLNAPVESIIFP
jgi:inosine-uridine nucleoside N-ribohydrolase